MTTICTRAYKSTGFANLGQQQYKKFNYCLFKSRGPTGKFVSLLCLPIKHDECTWSLVNSLLHQKDASHFVCFDFKDTWSPKIIGKYTIYARHLQANFDGGQCSFVYAAYTYKGQWSFRSTIYFERPKGRVFCCIPHLGTLTFVCPLFGVMGVPAGGLWSVDVVVLIPCHRSKSRGQKRFSDLSNGMSP